MIVLSEGDRVPADATLTSAFNLMVDESLLTGESLAVRKRAGDAIEGPTDRSAAVYSGTLVVGGHGTAVVSATGGATELGQIGAELSRLEIGKTSLQREVSRLVRILAVLGLAVCALGGGALVISVGMFVAALALGLAEPVVRMLTFSSLVIGNLALIFTNRSIDRTGLVRRLAPNRAMRLLTGGALLMLALVLYVPALNDL